MYTHEQRLKAVKLYIKYDKGFASVKRELGYPSKLETLTAWYHEYQETGQLHAEQIKKYTRAQKIAAVTYYMEHGKCIRRTSRVLGYPSCSELRRWILEFVPREKRHCRASRPRVEYSIEHKEQAVIALCSRCNKTIREIAEEYRTNVSNLYNWKRQLLGKESQAIMLKKNEPETTVSVGTKESVTLSSGEIDEN